MPSTSTLFFPPGLFWGIMSKLRRKLIQIIEFIEMSQFASLIVSTYAVIFHAWSFYWGYLYGVFTGRFYVFTGEFMEFLLAEL